MDYEYYYNNAKTRYYDACSEITSCQNKINELNTQKTNKVNQINELATEITNHETAYEQMTAIVDSEEDLNAKILDISNKTTDAGDNYIAMVSCSDITSKVLTDVYSQEMTGTKATLESILTSLKTKKTSLNDEIIELKSQKTTAESELEGIKSSLSSYETSKDDWEWKKSCASLDMEYYHRKMQMAVE